MATIEKTVWTQKRKEKNPKLGKKARRKTGAKVRKRRGEKEEITEEVEKKRSQDTGITRPPSQVSFESICIARLFLLSSILDLKIPLVLKSSSHPAPASRWS